MKLQPLSGDLVVKLALGLVVIGAAWWAVSKVSGAAGEAVDAAAEWAGNLAEAGFGRDNPIYSGINQVGGALASSPDGDGMNADGSWSLGGWLHDVINPDTAQAVRNMSGGATGSW